MKKNFLFVVAVIVLVAIYGCLATSCGGLTGSECLKDLGPFNKCKNNVCQCFGYGFEPFYYGCTYLDELPQVRVKGAPIDTYREKNSWAVSDVPIVLECWTIKKTYKKFIWFLNGQVISLESDETITILMNSTSGQQNISCKIDNGIFSSYESSLLRLNLYQRHFLTEPRINGVPLYVIPGLKINLNCITNISGVNVTFIEYKNSGNSGKEVKMPIYATNDNIGSKFSCRISTLLNGKFASSESLKVGLGHNGTFGSGLDPSYITQSYKRVIASNGTQFLTLTLNEPESILKKYVQYQWRMLHLGITKDIPGATSNSITFPVDIKNMDYSRDCVVTVNKTIFNFVYFPEDAGIFPYKIELYTENLAPLQKSRLDIKSRVFGEPISNYRYQWKLNGKIITPHARRFLSIDNFSSNDSGKYEITYFNELEDFYFNTSIIIPNPITKPKTPEVFSSNEGSEHSVNSKYFIVCKTDSITAGMVYKWFKDGIELTGKQNRRIRFDKIQKSDAGMYSCRAVFNNIESNESQSFNISVTDQGKPCLNNSDCQIQGSTGKCETNQRCSCVDDMVPDHSQCKKMGR